MLFSNRKKFKSTIESRWEKNSVVNPYIRSKITDYSEKSSMIRESIVQFCFYVVYNANTAIEQTKERKRQVIIFVSTRRRE